LAGKNHCPEVSGREGSQKRGRARRPAWAKPHKKAFVEKEVVRVKVLVRHLRLLSPAFLTKAGVFYFYDTKPTK